MASLVRNLNEKQLNTPYRPGGWTVKQVAHHVGDSHLNSYVRLKWTLTESNPIIKAYDEGAWANLADYEADDLTLSLSFLDLLHQKWVLLLKSLNDEQWDRAFIHPETNNQVILKEYAGLYAWHCNHHYAHIDELIKREGW